MGILKKISKNPVVRLTSLNGVSVITRIMGGFISGKMIAFLGPAGMAIVGNLRNALVFVDTFATLGMQNGIIKYTAQYTDDKEQLKAVVSTVLTAIITGIFILGLILGLPAQFWSSVVFNGSTAYAWVFIVLGCVLPFYAGGMVLVGLLNGLGKYNRVIYINIIGNILGVIVSAVLIFSFKTEGALAGLIFTPVLVFFLSVYPFYKALGGFSVFKPAYFSEPMFKNLCSYSLMSLVTALLGPAIFIILRNHITQMAGINALGYWEGINRISSFYMMFATTLQSVYFLPMLAKARTNNEIRKTWHSYYKIVVPVFFIGLVLIYLLRRQVIVITLSDAFLPMQALFVWQLLGDLFKVSSQILAQEFFARKMVAAFIISEIGSFAVMYISGTLLINKFGVEGATMAHLVTYMVYFAGMVWYFRKKLF